MFAKIKALPTSSKISGGLFLVLVLLVGWMIFSLLINKPEKISSAPSEVRTENPTAEDPMAELQKLLDEGKSKPVWKVYLETYWPAAAGAGVFLGLVIVIMRLIRKKDDTGLLDIKEEERSEVREDEDESPRPAFTMEEDSGPRWWQGIKWAVVVPILISVIAVLVAFFSGPSQKDIIASVKTNFEQRFADVQDQLNTKADGSTVSQLKSDLGKVREDAIANTKSLGILAGRADASDQKTATLKSRFENFRNKEYYQDKGILTSEITKLKKAKSAQDSINAAQDTVLAVLANKIGLTPAELFQLRRVLERPIAP